MDYVWMILATVALIPAMFILSVVIPNIAGLVVKNNTRPRRTLIIRMLSTNAAIIFTLLWMPLANYYGWLLRGLLAFGLLMNIVISRQTIQRVSTNNDDELVFWATLMPFQIISIIMMAAYLGSVRLGAPSLLSFLILFILFTYIGSKFRQIGKISNIRSHHEK